MSQQADHPPPLAMHGPRLLHTMLPVRQLEPMLAFYCGTLGMREIRRIEFPDDGYTLVFIGFDPAGDAAQVELRHDWGVPATPPHAASPGSPWAGHLGIGVHDIEGACARLAALGVPIRRAPAPMRPGGRVIALIEDPEGNEVELLAL